MALVKYIWQIHTMEYYVVFKKNEVGEFPGGLVVRIAGFHCHGLGSIPGHGTMRSCKPCGGAKKKKERERKKKECRSSKCTEKRFQR